MCVLLLDVCFFCLDSTEETDKSSDDRNVPHVIVDEAHEELVLAMFRVK
jgi:hypothetical protein